MNILNSVDNIKDKIIEHRRIIHSHPELSFQEYETSKYISQYLADLSIAHTIICNTGIVATIGDIKSGNCIAFRAELDALPIIEDTGLTFCSVQKGLMHACGHDLHIAMLLGAAEILKENESEMNGCVKFLFQPGEEVLPGGAKMMIENNALENPKPQMIFAQHIDPEENVGVFSTSQIETMATSCEITIKIKGSATHGSTPWLGADPIVVAAKIIDYSQSFMIRNNSIFEPAVLSICSIVGGDINNAFPEEITMLGTLRAFNEEHRNKYLSIFEENCKRIANAYNTDCFFDIKLGYPPVINNSEAVDVLKASVISLFDNNSFKVINPKMWADDFAYFAKEIPGCYYFIGAKDIKNNSVPPIHSPHFSPSEDSLTKGTAIILEIIKKCVQNS
jgi:hippurate hydrolase